MPDQEEPVGSSEPKPDEETRATGEDTEPIQEGDGSAEEPRKGASEASEAAASFPSPLREPTLDYFQSLPEGIRQKILTALWHKYSSVLELMLQSANTAVEGYHTATYNYKKWRIWIISATGTLAIINVAAAFDLGGVFPPTYQSLVSVIRNYLSLTAAVVAALIALFSNIESFLNYADLRSSQRQTRELFLDGFREFESLWHIHVASFGYGPQACFNATLLYRRLVDRDRELRRKLATDLKETIAPGSGAGGP